MPVISCDNCGKSFHASPSRMVKHVTHTCSRACGAAVSKARHSTKTEQPCFVCGKAIFYKPSHHRKIKVHCCSRKCRGVALNRLYNGENNPNSLHLSPEDRYFLQKWKDLRHRAMDKGYPFDITPDDLKRVFNSQQGLCAYSGLPMKLKSAKGKRGAEFNVASVDRINSLDGYVNGNILFCLNCLNMLKSNHSLEDIKYVFDAIRKKDAGADTPIPTSR